jgi:hypothetical protein
MNNIGSFAYKEPVQLPNSHCVLDGNFATHLAQVERLNIHLFGEVTHIVFARRYDARDQQSLAVESSQSRSQPHDVLSRAPHV